MRFAVVFKNKDGDEWKLPFKVYDTDLGRRWFAEVEKQCKDNPMVKHPDRRYHFPNDGWSEEYVVQRMNDAIDVLNRKETIVDRKASVGMPQDDLNYLHHFFETLRGPLLEPSQFWIDGDKDERAALVDLNLLIHRLEQFTRTDRASAARPRIVCNFHSSVHERIPLKDEDFELFEPRYRYGEACIHYCEIGKTLLNLYEDQDDIIGDDNIRPLHFFNASFHVYFFTVTDEQIAGYMEKFYTWWDENEDKLRAIGFEKGDPKNSIGNIPVAMVDTDLSEDDLINKIGQYPITDRITIEHEASA